MSAAGFHPLPQPETLSMREREDAMGAYLMMFAAWGVGLPLPLLNILAAVIYYFVNRDKGRFVRFHAVQSLTSQCAVGLVNAGAFFWVVRVFFFDFTPSSAFVAYLLTAAAINLTYFVFSVFGAVRARAGQMYYFWFFGKLAFSQVFAIRETNTGAGPLLNMPPENL